MSSFALAHQIISGTSTTSITFSNIPQTFTHLELRGSFNANNAPSGNSAYMGFNGDGASNYNWHYLLGSGSAVSSGNGVPSTSLLFANYPTASISSTSFFGSSITMIYDYSNTNKNKTIRTVSGYDTNTSNVQAVWENSGYWANTSAINSITISVIGSGNYFIAGSKFTLYGINTSSATGA